MLNNSQISLVQDSFLDMLPITDKAASEFYGRLFELAPDTRPLFKGDMVDQGRKLFLTLATVVNGLDQLDNILPTARELAIRHVRYGARESHYAAVGSALIETFRANLASFDAETEAAWVGAYTVISSAMITASRKPV